MDRRSILVIVSGHVDFIATNLDALGCVNLQAVIIRARIAIRLPFLLGAALCCIFLFPPLRWRDGNCELQSWLLAVVSIRKRIVFAASEPARHGILVWQTR